MHPRMSRDAAYRVEGAATAWDENADATAGTDGDSHQETGFALTILPDRETERSSP
jgi:hypothetical protein